MSNPLKIDLFQIKRGPKSLLPTLLKGEMYLAIDKEPAELYIGGSAGNVLLNKPLVAPSESVIANHGFVLADANKVFLANNDGNPITFTIPNDETFAIDTELAIVKNTEENVFIECEDGITINGNDYQTSYTIEDKYQAVALKKVAVDTWIMLGNFEEV